MDMNNVMAGTGLQVSYHPEETEGGTLRYGTVLNKGMETIQCGEIRTTQCVSISSGIKKVWIQAETMCGITGFSALTDGLDSYGCLGIPATERSPAYLIGALDLRTISGRVEIVQTAEGFKAEMLFQLDQIELRPGHEQILPDVVVLEGPSLFALLERYGELSGKAMEARVSAQPIHGWCSWYHYYGRETEDDILANTRELKEQDVLPPGAVIQIDDGWNLPEADAPRNWGDWTPGKKFPRGMKAVADDIHAQGFKAGLWLAPFSADAASQLTETHPDWLLGDSVAGLLEEGKNPVRGLDLTHPEVLAFLDETFERVFNDWGFDYVKLDFLTHAMAEGPRHDQTVTRTEALHRALQRIRKIAGDRFILCCGSPLGPAVGEADAMRVGFDVGSRWHAPMLSHIWPHGNCSIKPAAYASLHRQWMNGNWWLNDPDCLVVREKMNAYEALQFDGNHPGGDIPPEAFGLGDEEAGFWARLVYASGTFFMLSEVWNELPEQRQALVHKSFRVPESRFCLLDCDDEELLIMQNENGTEFAVFNLGDTDQSAAIPPGLKPGMYCDVFSDAHWIAEAHSETFPKLVAHAARIWVRVEED